MTSQEERSMTPDLHSTFPLGFQGPTPIWADSKEQDSEEEAPLDRELRAYLTECFFILPHRVIYCPEHQCVISMRGAMSVPDSYADYPLLAIYFAKFRLRKYPFDSLRDDIVWPPAYVVLNTIMRRLQTHRYLKGNANADTIPGDIRKAIAPNLEVPSGMEGELLEIPYSERKISRNRVTRALEGENVSRELKEFFTGLLGPDHAKLYPNISVIYIVSDYPIRTPLDLKSFAQSLRQLWYIEKIMVLVNMVTDSCRRDAAAVQNPSTVWSLMEDLQSRPAYTREQDVKMTQASVLLKAFPEEMEEFEQQRKDCRTFIYSQVRRWLPKKEKVKIYRGTSVSDDGSVKVSLNFTGYAYIKLAHISLRPVLAREAPFEALKVVTTFECRHVTREDSDNPKDEAE